MSRVANPYDNALAESFMATFKTECFDETPRTRVDAQLKVFDYIETFYNPKRLHSALGDPSPVESENQFDQHQTNT
jgi:putative transposase